MNLILLIIIIVCSVVFFVGGIVILSFVYIKRANIESRNKINVDTQLKINVKTLLDNMGGLKNVTAAKASINKVRINFVDDSLIKIEEIKKIKGVTGTIISIHHIDIVVGTQAHLLADHINTKILSVNDSIAKKVIVKK